MKTNEGYTAPAQILTPLLTVLFVGLKLTGYIAWPWLWVLAPVWMPLAAAVVFVVLMGFISAWWLR